MYNDIADIYLEIFPLNQAFLEFLPDYLGEPESGVLDLGCGPGDYVDYKRSPFDPESSPAMILVAKKSLL